LDLAKPPWLANADGLFERRPGQPGSMEAGLLDFASEGRSMFEMLEHAKTVEEKKLLTFEVIGAVIACVLIGGAAFWFFSYFSEY
jgi:hypothetical protein